MLFMVVSLFLESTAYLPYFVKIFIFNSDENIYGVYKSTFFQTSVTR